MDKFNELEKLVQEFSELINIKKKFLPLVHANNLFNLYMSTIYKDLAYIKIILERIKTNDIRENTSALGLDIKSLVIFCRIYSESLLHLVQLFIIDCPKEIEWNKIGGFIKKLEKLQPLSNLALQDFWNKNSDSLIETSNKLNYRNFIMHTKEKGTEWTMTWPGRDNLTHASIENAYRMNPNSSGQSTRSQTSVENINIIHKFTFNIFSYLKEVYIK